MDKGSEFARLEEFVENLLAKYKEARKQCAMLEAIIEEREPPTPAVWGVHPIETEDYPVPADMKDWG